MQIDFRVFKNITMIANLIQMLNLSIIGLTLQIVKLESKTELGYAWTENKKMRRFRQFL